MDVFFCAQAIGVGIGLVIGRGCGRDGDGAGEMSAQIAFASDHNAAVGIQTVCIGPSGRMYQDIRQCLGIDQDKALGIGGRRDLAREAATNGDTAAIRIQAIG